MKKTFKSIFRPLFSPALNQFQHLNNRLDELQGYNEALHREIEEIKAYQKCILDMLEAQGYGLVSIKNDIEKLKIEPGTQAEK